MALHQIVLFFFLLIGNLSADIKQIIFAIHSGDLESSLDLYEQHKKETGHHDLELIQQIGLILLDRGYRSNESEIQLLTLFGAGVAHHERCLYILEDGLNHPNPQIQLVALNMLARYQNDRADEALNRALGAPHLLIRLEALVHLAEKKHPKVAGQIEALMCKVDEELIPLFPPLYAIVGDAQSTRALKKLLVHANEAVRISAILSAAEYKRDDLLPQIRKLASHHDLAQQEACAIALGMMKDETMKARLKTMAQSSAPTLHLAAHQALYKLGVKESRSPVETSAKANNLFAIRILGGMQGSEELLAELVKSPNLQVRINSALSLLERQDPRSLKPIAEILLHDSRDLLFVKSSSMSEGLTSWKAVPSASQNLKENPSSYELSLNFREHVLSKAAELPQKHFLPLAQTIFEQHQYDLIPTLVEILQEQKTQDAINLLKKYQQKAGAPLIRNYCNLALFNLKEPGPYADNLRAWITGKQAEDLINFRSYIPWNQRDHFADFELTPDETSKLLIAAFEAFAQTQDDKGIDILLTALRHGNTKNRYALAGLLIRATM